SRRSATRRMCTLACLLYRTAGTNRDLPSFPTRRSSDLSTAVARGRPWRRHADRSAHDEPGCDLRRFLRPSRGDHINAGGAGRQEDRKSTRLNSSHLGISYAVFCLKKKNKRTYRERTHVE